MASKPTTRSHTSGHTPPLPPSSLLSAVSEESSSTQEEAKDESLLDSPPTDPSLLSLQEEEQLLQAERAAVAREAAQLRVSVLRRQLEDERAALQAATLLSSSGPSPPGPPPPPLPLPLSTPARGHTPVSRALFTPTSISAYKGPATAALAKKQAIYGLPLLPSSVPPSDPLPSSSLPSLSPPPPRPDRIRHTPPAKFTGDKEAQNAEVEQWIDEANTYFDLSRVPPSDHLAEVKGLFTGYALKWLREKREEVQAAGRAMTWDWLQIQLIDEFGRSSGVAAQQAEWLALRMGIENADGTKVGGRSTYTVKAYTSQFTRLMRALTSHTLLTTDLLVIDRYLQGIRVGYTALWNEMKGLHSVLIYDSLSEAITGAQVAESALHASKLQPTSSTSGYRGPRHPPAQVNNLEGSTDGNGPGAAPASESPSSSGIAKAGGRPRAQVNGFVYRPVTEEGRYRLTEAEQRGLYDKRLCYRCYGSHERLGSCGKNMTTAPRLN
jgi:hypothetical protein